MESGEVYAMIEKARADGRGKAMEQYTAAVAAGDTKTAARVFDAAMFGDATHAYGKEIKAMKPVEADASLPIVNPPADQQTALLFAAMVDPVVELEN